jgi:hypothetical protein
MAESVVLILLNLNRIGIILNKLISRPNHAVTQEEAEIVITIPVKVPVKNRNR